MRVLVHGGAGSEPDAPARRQESLDAATAAGADARSPEAAVEVAQAVKTETPHVLLAGERAVALAGRVGDVPQVGAGFYASEQAAASATGEGEAIARFGIARQAVRAVDDGAAPVGAAERTIERFAAETGATAGVIVLDRSGATGEAHNAEAMQTATHGDH